MHVPSISKTNGGSRLILRHFGTFAPVVVILMFITSVQCERNISLSLGGYTNLTHNNSSNSGIHSHGNHTRSGSHHGSLHVAAIAYDEVRDPLIFTIVVLLAALSKVGYHHANFLSSHIPESCILIILGTLFGAVIHFSGLSTSLPTFFKPHEFFIFLLPPIILEAAFSLHDRTFSENIGSILLFAVLGTVLACLMLGGTLYGLAMSGAMGEIKNLSFLQVMVFSSLIVAVDPVAVLAVFNEIGVNQVLYFLVFGESLLNDGVTVVLYKVFQAYNNMDEITGWHIFLGLVKFFVVCLGGLLIGVLAGIATALLTKHAQHVKVAQPLIIYTMAYLGFLMAELFEFSGIISIIGCGLVQMQYAFHNISDKSRTTLKYFTKVISSANEIIIFLFLGLVMVNDEHEWHTGFTLWTIFFCLVYRFIIIFVMSYIINWLDVYRVRKIGLQEQFMIAYGGLRGAVCFSLVALLDPHDLPAKNMFVTTTLSVILFTVFVQGISIKPLVYFLQISLAPEKNQTMYKELNARVTDHLMAGIEDIIGDHGKNHLRERMEYLDSKYLKPWLQVDADPRDSNLKIFYENLLLKEHYKYLKLSGAKTDEEEIPDLPHVNTELLLSTLANGGSRHSHMPVPMREKKPTESMTKPKARSAPSTPAITIEMEPITMRKKGLLRSYSLGEKKTEFNARDLRGLLLSQRSSRMAFSKYDKNLTGQEDMHSEIRKKTNRNKRLEKLFSEQNSPAVRRKSWSDSDAQLCEERGHGRKAPPRHAMTVDLGNATGRSFDAMASSDTISPSSPGWTLDSVFEEDESETQPMMETDGAKMTRSSSRLSSKHKLERQKGLDDTGGDREDGSITDETKVLTGKADQLKKRPGRLERSGSDPTGGHQDETKI
ncbi:Na(+)/H(+) exchanger beta-like [Biomphalaria glabrata]|uniref:Sodium/hydrogen exchanger n=1 Tax=Biomphalaria glabrata TaxID=6526 RepID=A0A9U8E148_BIOGL|nr:Na(+)/H(+) exchanger beta-like [Biomphalaria glabrata]XP_013068726.2 Na(+)/H(+) exchanger beta-like [Biomphalaria glabrata]XP_055868085.1 Na(+)/H(+) exchanger beta-like [Biomphalaria glabrata]XP_055868086.1 Na(+)/H(+) exchanger beta-like [Biomphalaria glabrata]